MNFCRERGTYRRRQVVPPAEPAAPAAEPCPTPEKPTAAPAGLHPDLGNLLVLLILLLVMVDSDDGDYLTPLVALAAFMFLQ